MNGLARISAYYDQTGRRDLTPRQRRRVGKAWGREVAHGEPVNRSAPAPRSGNPAKRRAAREALERGAR